MTTIKLNIYTEMLRYNHLMAYSLKVNTADLTVVQKIVQ